MRTKLFASWFFPDVAISIIVWHQIISKLVHCVPRSSRGKNQIKEAHNLTLSSKGTQFYNTNYSCLKAQQLPTLPWPSE